MRRSQFALAVMIGSSGLGFAQGIGSISAIVLDENQAPVEAALVSAHHAGEFQDMSPMCTTGRDGACTLTIQGPGRFAVEASKGQSGYPSKNNFYFGKGFKETIVVLQEANSAATVVLHVGPKAGMIKGRVFDAVTGKAMVGSVEFHWVSDQEIWLQTGISEIGGPVLIPANVPLTMVVTWEGYEDWHDANSDGTEKTIQLGSGEERHSKSVCSQSIDKYRSKEPFLLSAGWGACLSTASNYLLPLRVR